MILPFALARLASTLGNSVEHPSKKTNVSKNKTMTTEFRKNPTVSPPEVINDQDFGVSAAI